jgi:hypothetical protein
MAPSATETTTLPNRTAEIPSVKLAANTGPYKELSPVGYEKRAEEEGVEGFKAAQVRGLCSMPSPFPSRMCRQLTKAAGSTGTISQPGVTRDTLRSSRSSIETMA